MKDKFVIFDLDGTLYRTELVSTEAIKRALREMDRPVPDEDTIQSLYGDPMEEICASLLGENDREKIEELTRRIRRHEWELIEKRGSLYEGMEELICELEEMGFKMAVCSNGHMDYIQRVLKSTGIKDKFVQVRSREDGKTKGDVLGEILEKSDIENSFMIGDRIHDRKAALENGIFFIAALYGYGRDEIKDSELTVEQPGEILPLIKNRINR